MVASNIYKLELTQYVPFVKVMANRLSSSLYNDEYDDLVGAGLLGLVEASKRYNPSKGKFYTYAHWRVKGGMIDYLRTPGARSKISKGLIVCPLPASYVEFVEEATDSPLSDLENQEGFDSLISRCDSRTKMILDLHYRQGRSQKEIGEALDLTGSRICGIIKQSLELIKERLDRENRDGVSRTT